MVRGSTKLKKLKSTLIKKLKEEKSYNDSEEYLIDEILFNIEMMVE